MNWLSMFLQLLPTIVVAAEDIGGAWKGHQKKAAVQAGLVAIAQGVAVVAPQHAAAASDAAATASATIDGVVQVLNDAGVLKPHALALTASVASVVPDPVVAAGVDEVVVMPGPGLHNVNKE